MKNEEKIKEQLKTQREDLKIYMKYSNGQLDERVQHRMSIIQTLQWVLDEID
jgi:hypothetical protein